LFGEASASQAAVIIITAAPVIRSQNTHGRIPMPVLMIALMALAVFGAIGVMLAAAVILESRAGLNQNSKKTVLPIAHR
jgi:hypothetical protein